MYSEFLFQLLEMELGFGLNLLTKKRNSFSKVLPSKIGNEKRCGRAVVQLNVLSDPFLDRI